MMYQNYSLYQYYRYRTITLLEPDKLTTRSNDSFIMPYMLIFFFKKQKLYLQNSRFRFTSVFLGGTINLPLLVRLIGMVHFIDWHFTDVTKLSRKRPKLDYHQPRLTITVTKYHVIIGTEFMQVLSLTLLHRMLR